MWRIWLIYDPRRTLIGVLLFAFLMVMVNHFVQLSTPRYGSWLSGEEAMVSAIQDEELQPEQAVAVADRRD